MRQWIGRYLIALLMRRKVSPEHCAGALTGLRAGAPRIPQEKVAAIGKFRRVVSSPVYIVTSLESSRRIVYTRYRRVSLNGLRIGISTKARHLGYEGGRLKPSTNPRTSRINEFS